MTDRIWLDVVILVAGSVALLWAALVVFLLLARPRGPVLRETVRLLPDLLRLLARLVRDGDLPRGIRVRLWLLLGYLTLPIDLVPDFLPVIGYADDLVVIALTLRSVVRRAGVEVLERHWPGTPDGLAAVLRLAGHGPRTGHEAGSR